MICIDCNKNKRFHSSSLQCEQCYEKQNEHLKTRLRDVETYNEDRLMFLKRKSKELSLGYTTKEIKYMIYAGYTDQLILKTESQDVWTYGCEPSLTISRNLLGEEVRF